MYKEDRQWKHTTFDLGIIFQIQSGMATDIIFYILPQLLRILPKHLLVANILNPQIVFEFRYRNGFVVGEG